MFYFLVKYNIKFVQILSTIYKLCHFKILEIILRIWYLYVCNCCVRLCVYFCFYPRILVCAGKVSCAYKEHIHRVTFTWHISKECALGITLLCVSICFFCWMEQHAIRERHPVKIKVYNAVYIFFLLWGPMDNICRCIPIQSQMSEPSDRDIHW